MNLANVPAFQPRIQASWNVPFDLRPDVDAVRDPGMKISHVKDQQGRSSCTEYAAVGLVEMLEEIAGRPYVSYSTNFGYYLSRERLGLQGQDAGSTGLAAMTSLLEDGVPLESLWPSADYNVNTAPGAEARNDAAQRKGRRVEQIVNIDHIPCALAEGLPIYFEMRVCREYTQIVGSFADQFRANMSTHPFCFQGKTPIGNHAQIIMGNIPALEGAMGEGSWGPLHFDGGFPLLPYGVFQRGDAYLYYVVREFNGISIGNTVPLDQFAVDLSAYIRGTFDREPFAGEIDAWRPYASNLPLIKYGLTTSDAYGAVLNAKFPFNFLPGGPGQPPRLRGPGDY